MLYLTIEKLGFYQQPGDLKNKPPGIGSRSGLGPGPKGVVQPFLFWWTHGIFQGQSSIRARIS